MLIDSLNGVLINETDNNDDSPIFDATRDSLVTPFPRQERSFALSDSHEK